MRGRDLSIPWLWRYLRCLLAILQHGCNVFFWHSTGARVVCFSLRCYRVNPYWMKVFLVLCLVLGYMRFSPRFLLLWSISCWFSFYVRRPSKTTKLQVHVWDIWVTNLTGVLSRKTVPSIRWLNITFLFWCVTWTGSSALNRVPLLCSSCH